METGCALNAIKHMRMFEELSESEKERQYFYDIAERIVGRYEYLGHTPPDRETLVYLIREELILWQERAKEITSVSVLGATQQKSMMKDTTPVKPVPKSVPHSQMKKATFTTHPL